MRSCRWGLSLLLIMSFLAFSSSSWADKKPQHQRDQQGWNDQGHKPDGDQPPGSWADKKPQHQRDQQGWNDQGHKRYGDQPPGWDKGKKTGWRGNDLPPGQEKKHHQSYNHKPKYQDENDGPRGGHRPAEMPVPLPAPR